MSATRILPVIMIYARLPDVIEDFDEDFNVSVSQNFNQFTINIIMAWRFHWIQFHDNIFSLQAPDRRVLKFVPVDILKLVVVDIFKWEMVLQNFHSRVHMVLRVRVISFLNRA